MSKAVQSQRSSSGDWWKTNRSLSEIGEHLAQTFEERKGLERHLAEVLEENKTLRQSYAEAKAEHAGDCGRLQAEISTLRLEANEMLKQLQQKPMTGGRQYAELIAKERLIKDELERTIHALQIELKRERCQQPKRLEEMEARLARCICGDVRMNYDKPARPAGTAERWMIRNSK